MVNDISYHSMNIITNSSGTYLTDTLGFLEMWSEQQPNIIKPFKHNINWQLV